MECKWMAGGAEGVIVVKTDKPWCFKLSHILRDFMSTDCMSNHTGPFLKRTKVGFSWTLWGSDDTTTDNTMFHRKWRG
jgi:hypothetical protein